MINFIVTKDRFLERKECFMNLQFGLSKKGNLS